MLDIILFPSEETQLYGIQLFTLVGLVLIVAILLLIKWNNEDKDNKYKL